MQGWQEAEPHRGPPGVDGWRHQGRRSGDRVWTDGLDEERREWTACEQVNVDRQMGWGQTDEDPWGSPTEEQVSKGSAESQERLTNGEVTFRLDSSQAPPAPIPTPSFPAPFPGALPPALLWVLRPPWG